MRVFKNLENFKNEKETFLLTSHIDPDGDGIGGILGLYHALKNLGKDVRMVLSGAVGERYLFLPEQNTLPQVSHIIYPRIKIPS